MKLFTKYSFNLTICSDEDRKLIIHKQSIKSSHHNNN